MIFVKNSRGGREVNMVNTLSKINLSKIGKEGGGSPSIWTMSVNIPFVFFWRHPLFPEYVSANKCNMSTVIWYCWECVDIIEIRSQAYFLFVYGRRILPSLARSSWVRPEASPLPPMEVKWIVANSCFGYCPKLMPGCYCQYQL